MELKETIGLALTARYAASFGEFFEKFNNSEIANRDIQNEVPQPQVGPEYS